MSDISSVQLQQFKEAEQSRGKAEIKQVQNENNRTIKKQMDWQNEVLTQLKDDFERKSESLKTDLECKLIDARKRHEEVYASEKNRLDLELENIRKAHEDRVGEIKASHQNQLKQLDESHSHTLYTAQQKYAKEKMKVNG
ncbi:MAG: hypothetical protein A2X86_06070 [Bdellovibrionales bacterium GWA2_49_15]|nr:MAG: hypothetical protein A2X86_06070 [Bdellovibrionales bacterium GWA2_49_15]